MEPQPDDPAARALRAVESSGASFVVTRHGPVNSLEEAAAARGIAPERVLKSIVIRRGEDDYLFVLVPGGRAISWPKLRTHLGVNRVSLPDAEDARRVTGYVRGTITPWGSLTPLPVICDSAVPAGQTSIGGGASGVSFTMDRDGMLEALGGVAAVEIADVTS